MKIGWLGLLSVRFVNTLNPCLNKFRISQYVLTIPRLCSMLLIKMAAEVRVSPNREMTIHNLYYVIVCKYVLGHLDKNIRITTNIVHLVIIVTILGEFHIASPLDLVFVLLLFFHRCSLCRVNHCSGFLRQGTFLFAESPAWIPPPKNNHKIVFLGYHW